jgi:hypothetical protein
VNANTEQQAKQRVLTVEECEEIRKRADKATPGPWMAASDGQQAWPTWDWPNHREVADRHEEKRVALCNRGASDTRFVAHARTDIPDLLDTVAALREQLADCQRQLQTAVEAHNNVLADALLLEEKLAAAQAVIVNATDISECPKVRAKDKRIAELETALNGLQFEVTGALQVFGQSIRGVIGNTNTACLKERAEAARALLAGKEGK